MRILQTLIAFSGNAQPQLALTRRLVERGHEVKVLAHRAARARIEATGAQLVEFQQTQPDMDLTSAEGDTLRDWEARTRLGTGRRLMENGLFAFIRGPARECACLLRDWTAEAVVYDWMLTGAPIAAEAAGLPAVALVHCPYPMPADGVPPPFTGFALQPGDGLLGSLRDRALNRGAGRMLQMGLPALNRARAEQGLARVRRWEEQLLGSSAVCVMTAPELDFASRGKLPANVRYVGPAFEPYERGWSNPFPADSELPLVVISFSTSYMNQGALAQRVLDAVAGLPVRALLTAGPALGTSALRVPENARVASYVPHRAVFPDASLVVTHAGWQTVNAALADGVPLICIPDGRDQPDNAARVIACGAGLKVRKDASPARIRGAILRALGDSSLRRGAHEMAAALAAQDGASTVVEILEGLAGAAPRAVREA